MPERPAASARVANDLFDAQSTGTVVGTISWTGERPRIEPIHVHSFRVGAPPTIRTVPHPNAPAIAPAGGAAHVVVRIEGIDPRRAKAMETKELTVELDEDRIAIVRDGARRRTDWAPLGSTIRLANRSAGIGGIRARGSDFFTHMLPDANATVTRTLDRPGRTTFTSASGQKWAIADLFVSEHPYCAVTDEAGRFRFDRVPDGECELVAWHPHWRVVGHELDPETGVVARQAFAPAVEVRTIVRVAAGGILDVKLAFSTADFK